MLFSEDEACTYARNPLLEVICQLRFPPILSINENTPAEFQEAVRDMFPQFSVQVERVPVMPGQPAPEKPATVNNYQFISADGKWKLNLTQNFIALSTRGYTDWKTFAGMLDKPLSEFIQRYHPAYFQRVGLRYMNAISRKALGLQGTPWNDLIQPAWLGVLDEEDVPEMAVVRAGVDAELMLPGKLRLKGHGGPGRIQIQGKPEQEVRYMLDFDLSCNEKTEINQAAGMLDKLHEQADKVFQGAITIRLHEAMDPQ